MFASWNTLLHGALCFLEHFALKVVQGAKYLEEEKSICSRELSVPRSVMFQKAKCAEKQSVLGRKMFQGAECSREQVVLRGKVFLEAKYVEE